MNITEQEAKTIIELIGNMNYYETRAILCKTTEDEEKMNQKARTLLFMHNRLERELNNNAN